MKKLLFTLAALLAATGLEAKTLIAYYSFTNNCHTIATDLQAQTGADILRIEPAEKGLDYAADNYAIGSNLIAAIRANPDDASSYPAIDAVSVNISDYDMIIIVAPLWWSNMAAPMQTFLFQYGSQMAGKHIGLIVSSASSGISSVVEDAKRLIPNGDFAEPNLWIRSSQTSNCHSLNAQWLQDIGYDNLTSIAIVPSDAKVSSSGVFTFDGRFVGSYIGETSSLPRGSYIIRNKLDNGRIVINKIIQ